jgi:hypothetical protein
LENVIAEEQGWSLSAEATGRGLSTSFSEVIKKNQEFLCSPWIVS